MKDRLYAYIAGIMDGDGCFRVCSIFSKVKKRFYYYPLITLHQVDMGAVQLISGIYNRNINIFDRKIKERKNAYIVQFSGNELINFIKDILPDLIIKKRQAELCLELQEDIKRTGGKKLSEKELEYRDNIYQQVCALNQRKHISLKMEEIK